MIRGIGCRFSADGGWIQIARDHQTQQHMFCVHLMEPSGSIVLPTRANPQIKRLSTIQRPPIASQPQALTAGKGNDHLEDATLSRMTSESLAPLISILHQILRQKSNAHLPQERQDSERKRCQMLLQPLRSNPIDY